MLKKNKEKQNILFSSESTSKVFSSNYFIHLSTRQILGIFKAGAVHEKGM